ncbi:hypothetical protein GCM10023310_69500 [Paenibacillus vulneris]|uniref:Uncharacterized protein n=1 Tax=Paenibacillus vulneris TaxID=1133364 RepID=A0ABW3UID2_9BACL
MKQHITPIQAQELTENQFYSLFKEHAVKRKDWYKYHHKKISIGFMIEYLQVNLQMPIYLHTNGQEWNLSFEMSECGNHDRCTSADELCDLLWVMIKNYIKADYLED